MRAVAVSEYGGVDRLQVVQLDPPGPVADHVIVRVVAAAVNPTDLLLRRGGQARFLAGFEPPFVLGMDLAGTVHSVPPGSRWAVGDRVIGAVSAWRPGGGAQADFVSVPEDSLTLLPVRLGMAEGATLPMNGLTALAALDALHVYARSTLAIFGAAGAVGSMAAAIAISRGARVLVVQRLTDTGDTAAGAERVIASSDDVIAELLAAVPGGVDGVLDATPGGPDLAGAVRPGGRVAVLRPTAHPETPGVERVEVFVPDRLRDTAGLNEVARLAQQGRIEPRVTLTVAPENAAEAHRALEAGGLRGRPVILFEGNERA